MLILLDSPPVLLSPTVASLLWVWGGMLTLLAGWQFYSRKTKMGQADEIQRLKTALNAAESTVKSMSTELGLVKENVDRLRIETTQKSEEIGRLRMSTDLHPLLESVAQLASNQTAWIAEGRERFARADKHLESNHSEQTQAWTAVFEELRAQREEAKISRVTSEEAYRTLANAFTSHSLDDKANEIERQQTNLRFLGLMDSVERRFNDIAVQIGLVKWTPQLSEVQAQGKK